MNAADAEQLIARYAVSYYHDGPLSPCHPSDLARAKKEIQDAGELLKAMEHNGREAREALEAITARYLRAQQDGLFDMSTIEATPRQFHEPWLKAIQQQRGDLNRAKSELSHWREYWTWAKRVGGVTPVSPRELAEAKSYEDTRLTVDAR